MGSQPREQKQGDSRPNLPFLSINADIFGYFQLLSLQKRPGNDRCGDCGAPSPQWASPKFGTFICLTCAGLHRGLGVHISFVRSITMDAFKGTELVRMEMGGNDAWKAFWEANEKAKQWDEVGLQEKYGGAVGEEYKERLSCKVEGKEFTGMPQKVQQPSKKNVNSLESGDRLGRRTGSPHAAQGRVESRKDQNEDYFARMGRANASRSADLPPSQGGKYGGFGSAQPSVHSDIEGTDRESNGQGIPGVDEFQKDPVAALTKGFGWFTTTVGKGAKTVNEGWIQPAAQKVYLAHARRSYRVHSTSPLLLAMTFICLFQRYLFRSG